MVLLWNNHYNYWYLTTLNELWCYQHHWLFISLFRPEPLFLDPPPTNQPTKTQTKPNPKQTNKQTNHKTQTNKNPPNHKTHQTQKAAFPVVICDWIMILKTSFTLNRTFSISQHLVFTHFVYRVLIKTHSSKLSILNWQSNRWARPK